MQRLYFTRDCFYRNPEVPKYLGGHVYEIEDNMVERWLKRGALEILKKGDHGWGQAPTKPNDEFPAAKLKAKVAPTPVEELPAPAEEPPVEPPVESPPPVESEEKESKSKKKK